MRAWRVVAIWAGVLARGVTIIAVLGACSSVSPTPTASIATTSVSKIPQHVVCLDLPRFQFGECDRVVDAIRQFDPQAYDSASRVLVTVRCPPEVLCESPFAYDLLAVLVPKDDGGSGPIALHVLGHVGDALKVRPWTDPLPPHIKFLLAQE